MTKNIVSTKKLTLLMLVAFAVSLAARLYWVFWASGVDGFSFNNQVMINTNDGYFYAEGARDLIKGSHEVGDRSAVDEPVAISTMILYKILPFSIETLMLYMPAVLGSLIVVPIILLGRSLNQTMMSFFAAIFAATTYSYYNRTMAGYYDSDMFALIMPPFVAAFLISYFKEKRVLWQALLLISFTLSKIVYPQSFSWMVATIAFALLYTVIFERKNRALYFTMLLALVAISNLYLPIKALFMAAAVYFCSKITENIKLLLLFATASIALFAYFGGLLPVISALKAYVFKDSVTVQTTLKYYDVVQTVREAAKMDPTLFASRISGSMPVFILAMIGYALFIKKERLFALTLPILGLGLFAYVGGLRFTVYAVPFAALGLFYLIFLGAGKLNKQAKTAAITIAFVVVSLPNAYHIYDYKVPTVFTATVVKQLTQLGERAKREDYVFAWWDYGYPVRYYADVKNHSDGGKHDGSTNFIESFILTSASQTAAANMMRESVEAYEEMIKKGEEQKKSTLEYLLAKRGIETKNYESYLAQLASSDFKAAAKTRDVYLFLPFEMFEIFPTVKLFSNINLLDGKQISEPYFAIFTEFVDKGDTIDFGEAVFDKKNKTVKIGQNTLNLKSFSLSYYDKNGSLVAQSEKLSTTAELNLIYMPNYHAYILADDAMFNSLFVQLFVFENYDKNLFEKVSSTPEAKIFRLKI
jgi:dolichyl-diphosphooligosaccharide--protein glycosyltransferase/undecaprenyl-diphosphooligosaccharide--protein glycosyltransferase